MGFKPRQNYWYHNPPVLSQENIVKNIVDDAGAMIKRTFPGSSLNTDKTRIEIQLCFKIHSFTSKASAQQPNKDFGNRGSEIGMHSPMIFQSPYPESVNIYCKKASKNRRINAAGQSFKR